MDFSWTKDDVICTDRILSAFPSSYFKTDVFCMRDPVNWRGCMVIPPPVNQTLIIAGHSDYPITDSIVDRYPRSTWFAVNSESTRVTGIPLGITNDTDESPAHRVYGNIAAMIDTVSTPRSVKNLAYMNFSTGTYSERVPLKAMFQAVPWVTHGESINTFEGRRQFLEDIRNHDFVFSPRGSGVDTHRLWETLYMGSIPIVKRHITHAGWTDLPILFVDRWEEVTQERLLAERERILSSTWNFDKLRVGYWIDRIRECKQ